MGNMLIKNKELNNMENGTSIRKLEFAVLEAQLKLLQEQYAREMIAWEEFQIASNRITKAMEEYPYI